MPSDNRRHRSEVGRGSLINLSMDARWGLITPISPQASHCDPDRRSCCRRASQPRLAWTRSPLHRDFLSPRFNPPADAIALDGAGRIVRHLERAVEKGADREARAELMMGALEGGLTFQKGLGAVHGLSHALGSLKEPSLHHGTLNAVLLPPVLRFNASHIGDKYERLAAATARGRHGFGSLVETSMLALACPGRCARWACPPLRSRTWR